MDKIQADKYFEEGVIQIKKAQISPAINSFQNALDIYENLQMWEKVIETRNCIGKIYVFYLQQKLDYCETTVKIANEKLLANSYTLGVTYSNIGAYFFLKNKLSLALSYFEKNLSICLKNKKKDSQYLAIAYYYIGSCSLRNSDYINVSKYVKLLIPLLNDFQKKQDNFDNIPAIYLLLGNFYLAGYIDLKKAKYFYELGLQASLKIYGPIHHSTATFYDNIGNIVLTQSNFNIALTYFQKALSIRIKTLPNTHLHLVHSYGNIGNCYVYLNKTDKALLYYKKYITPIIKKNYGEKDIFTYKTFNNISYILLEKEAYQEAWEYLQILQKADISEPKELKAGIYENIGRYFLGIKNASQAIHFFQKSIQIYLQVFVAKHKKLAHVYCCLADSLILENKFPEALNYYSIAIDNLFFQKNNDKLNLEECLSLSDFIPALQQKTTFYFFLFQKLKDIKYLIQSYIHHQNYLYYIIIIRHIYQFSHESKLFLSKKTFTIYDEALKVTVIINNLYKNTEKRTELIQVFEQLQAKNEKEILPNLENAQNLAFEYAEQAKATLLFSQMTERSAKFNANIPQVLLDKEEDLRIEINFFNKQILQEKTKSEEQKDEKRLLELQSQHFDCQQQYTSLIEIFEKDYPAYYQLKHNTKVVNVVAVQAHLDNETALIEYFLGEKFIYIFCITQNTYEVNQIIKPSNFEKLLQDFDDSIDADMNRKDYIRLAIQLYQILLAPVLDIENNSLQNIQHLKIIPDGILSSLPFEALFYENVSLKTAYKDLPYLLNRYTVSYHFSATLWIWGKQQKIQKTDLPNSFIGFAPVYKDIEQQTEYNLETDSFETKTIKKKSVTRSVRSVKIGDKKYDALLHSEQEVQQIQQLFEQAGHKATSILHEKATVNSFKQNAQNYKYVHIAAHHVYNKHTPSLSSIVFSPELNAAKNNNKQEVSLLLDTQERNALQNNNVLFYISDAYNIKLNADLVVLSCCETGKGEFAKGEGMMAINRGFLFSGANNVLYTLFEVDDKEASQLTKYFFDLILNKSTNYVQALRDTKRQFIKNGNTPKHWAAYMLISN